MKRLLPLLISALFILVSPLVSNSQCIADFSISNTTCTNGAVSFIDMSTSNSLIVKQIWDYGYGKADTSLIDSSAAASTLAIHNYFENGIYTVAHKIITASGCTSIVSKNIQVSIKPQVAFAVGAVEKYCSYNQVTYTSESFISTGEPLSLLWKFGDDNSTSTDIIYKKKYMYPYGTSYQNKLKVTALNGCSDSLTKTVYVPNANFASIALDSRSICSSDSVTARLLNMSISSGTLLNRVWNWGDGKSQQDFTANNTPIKHKYNTPGKYYITFFITTSTCNLSYTDSVEVRDAPVVSLTATPIATGLCGTQTVNFINQTTSSNPSPILYTWTVNGIYKPGYDNPNQTYTFSQNGIQNIRLNANQPEFCAATLDTAITISGIDPKPNAIFAYETDTVDLLKYYFFDLSTIEPSGTIVNRYWNFGDGTSSNSTTDTASHSYAQKGSYVVEFIAATSTGCSDTLTRTIVVDSVQIALCEPSFSGSTSICLGSTANFLDSSYIKAGKDSLVKQIWDFGDGKKDTIYTNFYYTHPHVYNASGIYTVTLTIFTKRGCSSSLSRTITIRSLKTKSDFSYTQIPVCNSTSQQIQFTNQTKDYFGTLTVKWDFGDLYDTDVLNPLHSYAKSGYYTVKLLTRVSGCGNIYDTLTKLINVQSQSKADFIYAVDEIDPKTIQFTDKSYSGFNNIQHTTLDFGDGSSSTEKDPKHTYANYGVYVVKYSFVSDFVDCLPDTLVYIINIDSFKTLSNNVLLSNMGTEFWTGNGYIENMRRKISGTDRPNLSLYLAADENPATVQIDIPNMPLSKKMGTGFPKVVYIPAKSVVEVNGFPMGDPADAYNPSNLADTRLYFTGVTDRAIRITSNQPIGAWEHIYGTNNTAGGTLLIPTKMWSTSYIVQSRGGTSNNNNPNSFFFVIAENDSTTIEFTPTTDIIDSSTATIFTQSHTAANVKYKADVTYNILLNKGQVFNAMGFINSSKVASDLSGTKIISNNPFKRIAVFGGNGRVLINPTGCTNTAGSDNLIQQIFPKAAWGTKYLTVPTKTMETGVYRVTVDDINTNVSINGVVLAKGTLINKSYYDISRNQPLLIESDKRVMVTQYIATPGCPTYTGGNNGGGDPEMINLTPLKYGTKSVAVFSPTPKTGSVIGASYLNIIIKNEGLASLKIDNSTLVDTGTSSYINTNAYGSSGLISTLNAFKPHPGDVTYSYAKIKVATGASHTIASDSPFVAIAYGMADGETIGYNVGFSFNTLPVKYQYLGTGNWSNAINWLGNKIPPNPLPMGSEIIISGDCTMNVPQTIEDGARIVVETGGRLNINGNLIIQQ